MKKRIIILLIIVFFINIFILSSCKEHQHTFDEGRIIQEASCLVEGIKEYKCTKCDETKQETINKLEHIYETTIIKATCKEAGSETKVCKLCNDTKEKVLEKLEHTIVIDKAVEATCKNTGLTEGSHCSVCNEVIKKQEVISVLEHTYVDGKCSNCDAKDPNYKEEHTHTESNWIILEEATCTKEGKKQKMCTSCDEVLSEETIKKLEHTIVIDKAVEPSCTQTGLTEGTHCSVCKEIIEKQEIIKTLEHNYVNGKCSNCDSKDPNYKDENASEGLSFELNEDKKSYSVTGIGTCTDTNIIIPSVYKGLPVTSIGQSAFENCGSLTSIEIPNSVISIDDYSFTFCSLVKIEIPNSVTNIGYAAFFTCYNLTSIEIPNTVTSIGEYAFSVCTNLTSINVDINNQYYKSIDGNLYTKDGTKLIQYAIYKNDSSFVVPNSVTNIGNGAFEWCSNLTSIEISNSVTNIGDRAFYNCESLTSIEIPNSVTNIGDAAFGLCTDLTSITIPNSVTSIGEETFSCCERLERIVIPNSVTSIGEEAFSGCESLERIVIPNSVTSIGRLAFYDCFSLTSITIPNSVISIGYGTFGNCPNLTIFCETNEEPNGWLPFWNVSNRPVVWGYKND